MDMSTTQPQPLFVVDNYEPCPCHTMLVTRKMDVVSGCRTWVVFNVKNPCRCGFGNRVDYDFIKNEAYWVLNEKLKYKLHLDRISLEDMVLLSESLPYDEMYDEIFVLFPHAG